MNADQIGQQLEQVAKSDDFVYDAYNLTDAWSEAGVGFEAVEPVLRFMEEHPEVHFGNPGPLVHFIEHFYGPEYEKKLIESLERRPVRHTIWLLNRMLNITAEPEQRERFLSVMRDALNHPRVTDAARERIPEYLKWQAELDAAAQKDEE
jgi:hypothetical protein